LSSPGWHLLLLTDFRLFLIGHLGLHHFVTGFHF
jgi:hypothetical protein